MPLPPTDLLAVPDATLAALTQQGSPLSVGKFTVDAASGVMGTGTLAISGLASLADYQELLKAVTFSSTSDVPIEADRVVTITVTDDHTGGWVGG